MIFYVCTMIFMVMHAYDLFYFMCSFLFYMYALLIYLFDYFYVLLIIVQTLFMYKVAWCICSIRNTNFVYKSAIAELLFENIEFSLNENDNSWNWVWIETYNLFTIGGKHFQPTIFHIFSAVFLFGLICSFYSVFFK
jgi:hypothetical protein